MFAHKLFTIAVQESHMIQYPTTSSNSSSVPNLSSTEKPWSLGFGLPTFTAETSISWKNRRQQCHSFNPNLKQTLKNKVDLQSLQTLSWFKPLHLKDLHDSFRLGTLENPWVLFARNKLPHSLLWALSGHHPSAPRAAPCPGWEPLHPPSSAPSLSQNADLVSLPAQAHRMTHRM